MGNQEEKIQQALEDVESKKFSSYAQAAAFYSIPYSTLTARARGRPDGKQQHFSQQRLHPAQEELLLCWLRDLQRQGLCPNHSTFRYIVTQLLLENGIQEPLGKHWIQRFKKRHSVIVTGRTQAMEMKRLTALDTTTVTAFYDQISTLRELHNIELCDISNMDEKGFQLGQIQGEAVLFDKTMGPPVIPSTGITKWVSIIECTTADGRVIKPYVIHIGKIPQDHWFLPNDQLPDWVWGFSTKGWTNNDLAVDWLRKVYLPETYRPGKHRLLILDGHESHISGEFQYLCLQNDVHLVWLPPHSSHLLQPLDLGPFSSLALRYSQEVQKYTPTGFATIDRATFAHIYKIARPQAFTPFNIKAGWIRTGIQPWDPSRVLELPSVKNFGRCTPDLELPAHPDGVYGTPTKISEFKELQERIEARVTPHTRRHVHKLARGAIHELTTSQILQSEVRDTRKRRMDVTLEKRSIRLKKGEEQRSMALAEVLEARRAAVAREVRILRRKRPKKLIVIIPVKKPD
jgi:hypothetical protein